MPDFQQSVSVAVTVAVALAVAKYVTATATAYGNGYEMLEIRQYPSWTFKPTTQLAHVNIK